MLRQSHRPFRLRPVGSVVAGAGSVFAAVDLQVQSHQAPQGRDAALVVIAIAIVQAPTTGWAAPPQRAERPLLLWRRARHSPRPLVPRPRVVRGSTTNQPSASFAVPGFF